MPAIAREKVWTRDFVFGTAVNFLIMVNYYGLMVVVADYAMKTYDAPAATAGLAALSLIHISMCIRDRGNRLPRTPCHREQPRWRIPS